MNDKRAVIFCLTVLLLAGTVVGYAAVPQSTVRTTGAGITTYVGHFGNFTESVETDAYFLGAVNKTDIFAYPQQPTSYTVWNDTGTIYAKYGDTSLVTSYASLNATLNYILDNSVDGCEINILQGNYTGDVSFNDPPDGVYIAGSGKRNTRIASLTINNPVGAHPQGIQIENLFIYGSLVIERCSNVRLDNIYTTQLQSIAVWTLTGINLDIYNIPIGEAGLILGSELGEFCTNHAFYRTQIATGLGNNVAVSLNKCVNAVFDQLWIEGVEHGIELTNYTAGNTFYGASISVTGTRAVFNETDNTCGPNYVDSSQIIAPSSDYGFYIRSTSTQGGSRFTDNRIYNLAVGATGFHIQGAKRIQITGNHFNPTDLAFAINEEGAADENVFLNNYAPDTIDVIGSNTISYFNYPNDVSTKTVWFSVPNPDSNIGYHSGVEMVNSSGVTKYNELFVPADFQSLVSVNLVLIPAATGNIRIKASTQFGELDLALYDNSTDSYGYANLPVVINTLEALDISTAFTNISANDVIGLNFNRIGTSGDDTCEGSIYYVGVIMEYK